MTPEQWEKAQGLFEGARGLAGAERAAFLDGACGGDAELRAEVESLLGHFEAAGADFLASPVRRPAWPADETVVAEDAGDQVDHRLLAGATTQGGTRGESIEGYTITRELHRGGQGVVYQAIQLSTKRKVALKVLLEGPFASEKSRRRFEREIELVASLHHPNIVAVFDSGMAHGKYWFAMDYIRGKPLDEWVRARSDEATKRRSDEGAGARKKTDTEQIDETLKLFAKICNAVNYAHQRGVMHRDLKPGNVLVDDQGEPHVLDFGLAKVLAAPDAVGESRPMLVSVTGQVMGTLPYMSPEQARGDPSQIDIRTDVYSLGVILYEMLTGKYPYEVVGQVADVLRNIAEAEPKKPSKTWVASGLRAGRTDEIDTIVLKALAKEPTRRYQSAGHFADDLQRFMSGDPIEAKRDSAWYVLRKSLRKHGTTLKIILFLTFTTPLLSLGLSALIVWYISHKPYRLEMTNNQVARLVARNGNVLHEWLSETPGVLFAAMRTQPSELGGRRIALIGLGPRATNADPWGLSAIDVDGDLSKPLWHNCVEDDDIPTALRVNRRFVGAEYGLQCAILADVFPDRPCPQIVAAFQNDYTHTSLRVIDLAGVVLSEVWVDAHVQSMYWMSEPRLLVITGSNGEVVWEDRGFLHTGGPAHPTVLFALRPALKRLREYVVQEGDPPPGTNPALVPAWYQCLMLNGQPPPPETALLRLNPPRARWPATDHVQIALMVAASYPPGGAFVSWVFDPAGKIVDGPTPGAGYQRNQSLDDDDPRKLPPVEAWQWVPLPPRLPHIKPGPSVWKPGDNKLPILKWPQAPK